MIPRVVSTPVAFCLLLAISTSLMAETKRKGGYRGATPRPSAKTTPKPDTDDEATPKPKPKRSSPTPASKATPTPEPESTPKPRPSPTPGARGGMLGPDVATLSPDALAELSQQPAAVQRLIRDALALTDKNLGYLYGSSDPAQGGMDCSGTIYYTLRQHGFKDVPRDSSGQFLWLRERGTLRELTAADSARFDSRALRPGDLLFWSGTYTVERETPITHVMLYLGTEKATGKPVMWGASDGRPYGGKARYGVSVFEFRLPKADAKAAFVGFGQVPAR